MSENWLDRWENGRTGWHEVQGNAGLHRHWPALPAGTRVLVPLAGKTPDVLWLARRGCNVCAVELSEIAVRAFFAEQGIDFRHERQGEFEHFVAESEPLEFWCGDYFQFSKGGFDALYDRGALVALPPDLRQAYVRHTDGLLCDDPVRLVVTLEYDQNVVGGPPFAVNADELARYWPDLVRVEEKDDLETCPPKFRSAGLTDIREVFWLSGSVAGG